MKIRITVFILFLLTGVNLGAQTYGSDKYTVAAYVDYGYNSTWKNFGGLDVRGFFPLSNHFEMMANAEILSSGVFAASLTARPKFKLRVGEIFIDASALCRDLFKYKVMELTLAASAGYRMDYISAQLGLSYRGIFDTSNASEGNYVGETLLNLAYRVAFQVRPVKCRWNVGGGISNFDEYEYERMWQPMFFIDGHFDLNEKLSLLASIKFKQAGMFHQIASFYGIETKAGVSYKF
ncbi:MAG: hypothetical protein KBS57_03685 [Alistipes sp.]|nr:hypothetical protein [Candidatus Minthomonas equi]